MPRVAQLMSFPQPASEKQARKKSNEMEWESSPGGADGQSVAPPGNHSVLHDQQEAVWLAAELLVRPSVRAAWVWVPPFPSTSTFSRIDLECKSTHHLTSGGDFIFYLFFFSFSFLKRSSSFHSCPPAMSGLLSDKKTVSLSDRSFYSPPSTAWRVWVCPPVRFVSEKSIVETAFEELIQSVLWSDLMNWFHFLIIDIDQRPSKSNEM